MLLSYPRIAVLITDATDNSNVRKVANTVHRQPKPNANVKSPALSSVASHIRNPSANISAKKHMNIVYVLNSSTAQI